ALEGELLQAVGEAEARLEVVEGEANPAADEPLLRHVAELFANRARRVRGRRAEPLVQATDQPDVADEAVAEERRRIELDANEPSGLEREVIVGEASEGGASGVIGDLVAVREVAAHGLDPAREHD